MLILFVNILIVCLVFLIVFDIFFRMKSIFKIKIINVMVIINIVIFIIIFFLFNNMKYVVYDDDK